MGKIVTHGHFITNECNLPDKDWYKGRTQIEIRIKGVQMRAMYCPCSYELYIHEEDLHCKNEILTFITGRKYQTYIRRKYNARQIFLPKYQIEIKVWPKQKQAYQKNFYF